MDKRNISKLVFLHIPKAGGSTLLSLIQKQYDPRQILRIEPYYDDILAAINLPDDKLMKYEVFSGHFPFELVLRTSLKDNAICMTMLRDPIDRVISFYYYVLRTPNHYLYEKVCGAERVGLKEFVDSRLTHEIYNGQTRQLASSAVEFCTRYQYEFEEMNTVALEKAKTYLKDYFPLVGITEKYDLFLLLAKKILGWKDINCVKQNVSNNKKNKDEIPDDVKKIIKKNNQFDIELYEYAKTLFEKALEKYL